MAKRDIVVNDIILITDETMQPAEWPLARVLKVYTGSDNLTRDAELRTSSTILTRPIHKLILLDVKKNELN